MNKTLEKILEDELFENETFEGEGSLQIKNTSEGTKLPIILGGNSVQDTEYIPVDYIESDGSCYIDTEYMPNYKTIIETKLYTEETGNRNWFGTRPDSGHAFCLNSFSSDALEYNVGNGWRTVKCENVTNNVIEVRFGKGVLTVNNNRFEIEALPNNTDAGNNLFLFVRNGNENNNVGVRGRCYYFRIFEDDKLIKNLVPCYRKSDKKIGFYDLLNDQFFENQGTGNFTYNQELLYPNLDFPIEIQNCKNINISVMNKNLLHFGATDYNWNLGKSHTEGSVVILTGPQSIGSSKLQKTRFHCPLKKGTTLTYSIRVVSGEEFLTHSGWCRLSLNLYYTDGTEEEIQGGFSQTLTTFTLTKDVDDICFYLGGAGAIEEEKQVVLVLQLEIGDFATEYEPHQEQSITFPAELCGLKTQKKELANYIDENGQAWICDYLAEDGIHKRTWKVQVKSNNVWFSGFNQSIDNNPGYGAFVNVTFGISSNSLKSEYPLLVLDAGLCTIARYGLNKETSTTEENSGFLNAGSETRIHIPKSSLGLTLHNTSSEIAQAIKDYLDNHEVYLLLAMAEEIIEPYSEEQKQSYNKLIQATAYDDETNIICEDEIPCNFRVDAKISKIKKLKEQINAQIGV